MSLPGKKEFCEFCRLVQGRGLVSGSGGNLSLSLEGRILISPSGRPLGALREEDVVELLPDGSAVGGRPSSERRMHEACYAVRPELRAVLHVHSPWATALSCSLDLDMRRAIPVLTPGYGKRVGELPALPYRLPGSAQLAEEVGAVIARRDSVLLCNHGVVTVGRSFEEALVLAEEIEAEATMFLLLGRNARQLDPDELAALSGYQAAGGGV